MKYKITSYGNLKEAQNKINSSKTIQKFIKNYKNIITEFQELENVIPLFKKSSKQSDVRIVDEIQESGMYMIPAIDNGLKLLTILRKTILELECLTRYSAENETVIVTVPKK